MVIHRDPSYHDDLSPLRDYILDQLNVKELILATEDSKYGVQLKGDPDNERLGKRLKGDFKKVAPAIKALTSKALTELQATGEVTVEGHVLTMEDIKVVMRGRLEAESEIAIRAVFRGRGIGPPC